jgi:hypothetical protein
MKNVVLTILLAVLVVLTSVSLRRLVAGNATATGRPALVAIGVAPVPPVPPPPKGGGGNN